MAAPTAARRPAPARKPMGLGDTWNGLPIYAWVGIGALSVAGLYVFVSRYRKAKTASKTPATSSTSGAFAPGGGNQALPGNQLLEPIIINGGGSPSQPLPAPAPAAAASGLPPGDDVLAADIALVNTLYNNVLHRQPEPGGFNYWLGRLIGYGDSGQQLQSEFLTAAQPELRGTGQQTTQQASSQAAVPVAAAQTAAGVTTQPASSTTSPGAGGAQSFSRLAA